MHKKFEINQTKIKGGCQLGRTVVTHNFKSDLPLAKTIIHKDKPFCNIQETLMSDYLIKVLFLAQCVFSSRHLPHFSYV